MLDLCFVLQYLTLFQVVLSSRWRRELIALLLLYPECHVAIIVIFLFLALPWVGLLNVNVAISGLTHLLLCCFLTFNLFATTKLSIF